MTLAWYGHLKFKWLDGRSLLTVILVSWGIAFFEYCLMVPANRLGYLSGTFTGYQLKIIQECVTLGVFIVFAWLVLKGTPDVELRRELRADPGGALFRRLVKPGSGTPGGLLRRGRARPLYYTPAESCFPYTIFRHRGRRVRRRSRRQRPSFVTSTEVSMRSVSQLHCLGCGSAALGYSCCAASPG